MGILSKKSTLALFVVSSLLPSIASSNTTGGTKAEGYPALDTMPQAQAAYNYFKSSGNDDPVNAVTSSYRNIIKQADIPNSTSATILRAKLQTQVHLKDLVDNRSQAIKTIYNASQDTNGFNQIKFDRSLDTHLSQQSDKFNQMRVTKVETERAALITERNVNERTAYAEVHTRYKGAVTNVNNAMLNDMYSRMTAKSVIVGAKLRDNQSKFDNIARNTRNRTRYFSGCGSNCYSLPSQNAIPSSTWNYTFTEPKSRKATKPYRDYECSIKSKYWEDNYSEEAYYCP